MKIQHILVIGGTGMLGFPVAKQLIADGYDTSILTRNPKAAKEKFGGSYHFLEGDVQQPASLKKVFNDHPFDALHINLSSMNYEELKKIEVAGTKNVIEAAKTNGIQKITLISGLGVHKRNEWARFVREKMKVDSIVRNSGIPYTIFNCTHFMESISQYIRNGKITIIGKQPSAWSWVAAGDYAKMVSKAFSVEESNNKVISVLGPEQYTMKEVFSKYIEVVNPALKLAEVPIALMRIIAAVSFNQTLKFVVDLMAYFDKSAEVPAEGTVLDVLGTPSTTLEEWLLKQKERKLSV